MACPWWDSDELSSKNKEEPKVEDNAGHHEEEVEDQNENQEEKGFDLGYEKGYEDGYDKGLEDGYDEGYEDCLQESYGIDRSTIEYAVTPHHDSDYGHDSGKNNEYDGGDHGSVQGHDCSTDSVYGYDDDGHVGYEYDFESDHGGWSHYD